jgi:hypothetical protein
MNKVSFSTSDCILVSTVLNTLRPYVIKCTELFLRGICLKLVVRLKRRSLCTYAKYANAVAMFVNYSCVNKVKNAYHFRDKTRCIFNYKLVFKSQKKTPMVFKDFYTNTYKTSLCWCSAAGHKNTMSEAGVRCQHLT